MSDPSCKNLFDEFGKHETYSLLVKVDKLLVAQCPWPGARYVDITGVNYSLLCDEQSRLPLLRTHKLLLTLCSLILYIRQA